MVGKNELDFDIDYANCSVLIINTLFLGSSGVCSGDRTAMKKINTFGLLDIFIYGSGERSKETSVPSVFLSLSKIMSLKIC